MRGSFSCSADTWGHTTNSFSVICFTPSRHLCPTISVTDCGQEIPQLRYPSWDVGPEAVPQERLRQRRVHQHLCSRLGDWAGLRRRRQAPQPILSTGHLAPSLQQKDSASPKGLQLPRLPFRIASGKLFFFFFKSGRILLVSSELQPAVFCEGQRQPPLITQESASRNARNSQALSLWALSGFSGCGVSVREPTFATVTGPFCQSQNIS